MGRMGMRVGQNQTALHTYSGGPANKSLFTFYSNYTLSTWVYRLRSSSTPQIIISGSEYNLSPQFAFGFLSNHLFLISQTSNQTTHTSSLGWTFISINFQNQIIYSSIDFTSLTSSTFTNIPCATCDWGLGYVNIGGLPSLYNGKLYNSMYLDGFIHSVYIDDWSLTSWMIESMYLLPQVNCQFAEYYQYFW